jgi:hypothetical protein
LLLGPLRPRSSAPTAASPRRSTRMQRATGRSSASWPSRPPTRPSWTAAAAVLQAGPRPERAHGRPVAPLRLPGRQIPDAPGRPARRTGGERGVPPDRIPGAHLAAGRKAPVRRPAIEPVRGIVVGQRRRSDRRATTARIGSHSTRPGMGPRGTAPGAAPTGPSTRRNTPTHGSMARSTLRDRDGGRNGLPDRQRRGTERSNPRSKDRTSERPAPRLRPGMDRMPRERPPSPRASGLRRRIPELKRSVQVQGLSKPKPKPKRSAARGPIAASMTPSAGSGMRWSGGGRSCPGAGLAYGEFPDPPTRSAGRTIVAGRSAPPRPRREGQRAAGPARTINR